MTQVSHKKRSDIEKRDDIRCQYCGIDLTDCDAHTRVLDHKEPKRQGGKGTRENLVLACRSCNSSKGNRTVEEFRRALFDNIYMDLSAIENKLIRWIRNSRISEKDKESASGLVYKAINALRVVHGDVKVNFAMDREESHE